MRTRPKTVLVYELLPPNKCRSMYPNISFGPGVTHEYLNGYTSEESTVTWGELEFHETYNRQSLFMVSNKAQISFIYELLKKNLHLPAPDLLVSVVSEGGQDEVTTWVRKALKLGLMCAAQSTGAWIITNGLREGVSRCVGEAVRDHIAAASMPNEFKVVALGVAPLSLVTNRQHPSSTQDLCRLDSNYQGFLLVDDQREDCKGIETDFITDLEHYIPCSMGRDKSKIPVLCLLVSGGASVLKRMEKSLKKETQWLVLSGSGPAADMVSELLSPSPNDTECLKERVIGIIGRHFPHEEPLDELVDQAVNIYENRHLITVFHGKQDDTDFDTVNLKAVFNACKQMGSDIDHEKQMKLALTLNRVDFAKSELFNRNIDWKYEVLDEFMKYALVNNKAEFVRLFAENGLNIPNYLTYERWENLYQSLSESSLTNPLLQKYLKKSSKSDAGNQKDLISQVSELLSKCFGGVCQPFKDVKSLLNLNSEDGPTAAAKVKFPWMSLFIWSVLQNRSEMAMYFWEMSGEPVLSALCACKILRELAEVENATENKLSLRKLAQKFEEKAFDVFNACYHSSESRSFTLLTRTSRMWGKVTCLEMAVAADARHFFSHDGVQTLLSQIWWGYITEGTAVWRLVFSILMPPLIFTNFISFSEPQLRHTDSFEKTKHVSLQEALQEGAEDDKFEGGHFGRDTIRKTGTMVEKAEKTVLKEWKTFYGRWEQFWLAPVTTFIGNTMMFFPFLFLFAYVLLVEFKPPPEGPAPLEFLLYFWVFTMVCEEIRQCFDTDRTSFSKSVMLYVQNKWNKFDLLAITLFCLGLTCRMFSQSYWVGRSVLCVDYMVFNLRLIHIFAINKELGPKIIIIGKMMKDVFFFLFLFGVWLMAYGVANQALLYSYDPRPYWVFRRVFYRPYLLIYGHLPLEELDVQKSEKGSCTNDMNRILEGEEPCINPEANWLVLILLAVYLLVTNIVLLNLLIAVFSNTFNNVQENSDKHWKFQRYDLIAEYHYRSCLAPPFIIFSHLIQLIDRIIGPSDSERTQSLTVNLNVLEVSILNTWEAVQKENLLSEQSKKQWDSDTERLKRTSDKVDNILKKITDQNHNKPALEDV